MCPISLSEPENHLWNGWDTVFHTWWPFTSVLKSQDMTPQNLLDSNLNLISRHKYSMNAKLWSIVQTNYQDSTNIIISLNLLTPHQYISLRVSSPHTHTQEAPYWLEITLQQCSSTALSALSDLLCSVWIFRELTDFPLDFAGFFPQATWKPRKNPVQPGKFPVILAIWHNHRQWSKRFILFLWFMQVSQAVVT